MVGDDDTKRRGNNRYESCFEITMARYLFDTNVLVYILLNELDNLSRETRNILEDYDNQLYTSSIVVIEVIQLFRIGKIKSKDFKTNSELYFAIENILNIKMLPFSKEHTQTLAALKIESGHNDPFDHSIISHAITEKMILVSSDKKFEAYKKQNLLFSFNKR